MSGISVYALVNKSTQPILFWDTFLNLSLRNVAAARPPPGHAVHYTFFMTANLRDEPLLIYSWTISRRKFPPSTFVRLWTRLTHTVCCAGYLPPQLTSSLQMPPSLAVAPSAVPSLSAAFGRQLTAGAPNAALAAAFGMTFGAQRRSSLPSCVQLREFLVRTRGLKRKAEWTTATAATATAGGDAKKASTTGGAAATAAADQPLYCRICRVTLNAPNQARQHYEGKTHAKRLRLFIGGSTTDSTTSDQVSDVLRF